MSLINNDIISPESWKKRALEKAGFNLLCCSYVSFCIEAVVGLVGHI